MSKRKIKFYLNHGRFIKVGDQHGLFKFLKALLGALVNVCYLTGLFLVKSVQRIFSLAVNDISKTREFLPKRVRLIFKNKFVYTLIIFFIFSSLAWTAIASLSLVAKGLDLKNKVMLSAFLGNSYLSKAKTDLANKDLESAQTSFSRAYQTFNKGQQEVNQSGQLLNSLLSVIPQKQAADNLLKAATLVSQAGQDMIVLNSEIKKLKISPTGINSDEKLTEKTFNSVADSLNQVTEKIDAATKLVSSVNEKSLPEQNRQAFVSLAAQLQNADLALKNFNNIFSLFKDLLLGQKTVLVLFENNNELRASGGFIGTYGTLKLKDGQIQSLKVSSIYDLDGQLIDYIKPPQPLLNVGPRFFMRDSNWFASFPESAKQASNFYEIVGGQTPDLVIAMTPNFIIDLIKITGPVSLPNYGVTLTEENFIEQTQGVTTLSNNLPTNSPKQMLADLFPILLQRLSKASSEQWAQVVLSIQNEFTQKQIAIYSRDENIQNKLNEFHWTGALEKTEKDYLSINSSNLGGTKTDLSVDQKVNLTTSITENGSILNQVSITRTNKMPNIPSTENLSYIRVFVPLGSRLISNSGFDYKTMDFPENTKYSINDSIFEWEKNSLTDNLTQTRIGQESNKTYFGNWLKVSGGETKTVVLIYELPFKLSNVDRYSLLLQKQMGSLPMDFSWSINFPGRRIAWKNFDVKDLNTNSLNSDIMLNKDNFFGIVFSK